MKRLKQELCTHTDSFTYTVVGEKAPRYHVDSSGWLTENGEALGKFCLADNRWHLRINDVVVDSSPPNSLFLLPEFELKVLTDLVNNLCA